MTSVTHCLDESVRKYSPLFSVEELVTCKSHKFILRLPADDEAATQLACFFDRNMEKLGDPRRAIRY